MSDAQRTQAAALPESTRTAAKAEGMNEIVPARFARQRAGQIRQGMRDYLKTLGLIKQAWDERDWETLGYSDWQSYVDAEYSEHRLQLSREHRQKAVQELRLAGMSTRAIGSALGVHHSTVAEDLSTAGIPTVDRVMSLDGRERPATQPPARRDPELTGESAVATTGGPEPEPERPPAWDPAERRAHEEEVTRRQQIEAARRSAENIVTTVRAEIVTIVTGCRYGESGLVTKQMVVDLREVLDLLEGEL